MATRRYEQRERAKQAADTRQRITEATVDLHRTVGPAATTVAEIARRAGVQRVTVYKHFPDDAALIGACSAHWRALHPAPDPDRWSSIAPPAKARRAALTDLYEWYRETEPMTANVLRDAGRLPPLAEILDRGLGAYLERVHAVVVAGLFARRRTEVAGRAAIDFHFWRSLSSLGDPEAAELAAGMVEAAASGRR
jgi:AcrR family transcriptional regulator